MNEWQKFIEKMVPDAEERRYLALFFKNLGLFQELNNKVLFFVGGNKITRKCFIDLAVLCADPLRSIENIPNVEKEFENIQLATAKLIFIEETTIRGIEKNKIPCSLNELSRRIKRVLGRDSLVYRHKHVDNGIIFRPKCSIVMSRSSKPDLGDDLGLSRRLLFVNINSPSDEERSPVKMAKAYPEFFQLWIS